MKPLRLRLKGFTGIWSGLQKSEITLDLTVIPENAVLVALVAENGKGKSTILDNLHPYRIMPGRTRGIKPSAFSYWGELREPVAEKEFDWEYRGEVYRTSLVFKTNGKTQSQTAFLLGGTGGSWEPVRLADGIVSDGGTASYDACVEEILGRPEVFFTTAFEARKRTMLAEYDTGSIKKLLSIWLNVDPMLKASANAAEVASLLGVSLSECQAKLRNAPSVESAVRSGLVECQSITDLIASRTAELSRAEAVAEETRNAIVRLDAQIEGMRQTEVQRVELRRHIQTERSRGEQREQEIRLEANTSLALYRQTATDLAAAIKVTTGEVAGCETQISGLVRRLGTEDRVNVAVQRVKVLDARQSAISTELEAIQKQIEALKPVRVTVTQQIEVQATAQANGIAAKERQVKIETVAALADKVPCVNTDLQPRCELLADALAAKASLAQVQKELLANRGKYRSARDLLKAAGIEIKQLEDLEAKEAPLRKEHAANAQEITALNATASQAALIAEAKMQHPQVAALLVTKQQSLVGSRARLNECNASLQALSALVEQRVAEARKSVTAAISGFETRLAALPAEMDAKARASANEARSKAEQQVTDLKQVIADLRNQLTAAQRQLAQAQVLLEQLEPIRTTAAALTQEIAKWRLTSEAIGKNGVVALTIDDAGPDISALANDLLSQCYEGNFVVRFETQLALKSGEMREGFDIRVLDVRDGDEKSIDELSGGQEVFVNECVTRGVALHLAQSGSYRFDTLFTDESDGPLDENNKRRFMAMKRRILDLGKYSREYFVTQTSELQGMADYTINVAEL